MKVWYKISLSVITLLLIMFVCPILVMNFLEPLTGFGWLFILMFIVNPIVSLCLGILAGTNIHKLWWIPFLIFLSFFVFYSIVLESIIFDLLIYSTIYLVISSIMMIFSMLINKNKK